MIVFGVFGLAQRHQATGGIAAAPEAVVSWSVERPDETPVDINQPYSVPDHYPRSISIPSIGAEGFIQQVGVLDTGEVAVPSNIHYGGWYNGSALPGSDGVSLIAGHVNGRYTPAIFKQLETLTAGDRFIVELGDRSELEFEIVSIEAYSVDDIDDVFMSHDSSIAQQLNLITCAGSFDADTQQYSERVLVKSMRV